MRVSQELFPVVSESNEFLRCADRNTIHQEGLPHRTVWGMVYSPARRVWLSQWRRFDKQVCPGEWDISCAGHVDCVDGCPETYEAAYAREMGEELSLQPQFIPVERLALNENRLSNAQVPTVSLGYSKEYHFCTHPSGKSLEKEHVCRFLSFYDGPVQLSPNSEPMALGWFSDEQLARLLIEEGAATPGFAGLLSECQRAVQKILY